MPVQKTKSFQCNYCRRNFHNKLQLQIHKWKFHTYVAPKKRPFVGRNCAYGQRNGAYWQRNGAYEQRNGSIWQRNVLHGQRNVPFAQRSKRHGSSFASKARGKEFSAHKEQEAHKCAVCAQTFRTSHLLVDHMVYHSEPEHECKVCGMKFWAQHRFENHLKAHQD